MARTALTVITAPGATPLALTSLTFTAVDVANGNSFAHTGREVVLALNTNGAATARNIKFQSVAVNGRQDPLHNTNTEIPAGLYRVIGPFGNGWRQTDGLVYLDGDNAELLVAVVRMPE